MKDEKPSWEEYALEIAKTASIRSEDPFVKVGACALNHENMVVGVGYNGLASGKDLDWENFSRDERRPLMIHAETNCLSLCKKGEVNILAVTLLPCSYCANMISAYGINTVVYESEYEQEDFDFIKGIFDFNDIKLIKISDEEDEPQCLSQGRKVVIPNDDSFRMG